MSNLEGIKAKIRALRSKTMANGCTEAEASAAMQKAAALMATYGVDAEGAEIMSSAPIALTRARYLFPYSLLWHAIEDVCRASSSWKAVRRGKGWEYRLVFAAREPDMLMAEYLYEVLDRAISRVCADFRKDKTWRLKRSRKTRDLAMEAHMTGFCLRLWERMNSIFAARLVRPEVTVPDTATAEPRALSKKEKRAAKRIDQIFNHAGYSQGIKAAEGVHLSEAMTGGQAEGPALIGGGK
ncbi:DUF2786 domain-containing protein [Oleomonas cavernae]|uniref:DUF2786 domain-containing protein n=1 Tax=Oleomonas cavernae TaxID=2320859 RepID=A0A418WU76_9PROT|nr:DUF2786 domain-containing protein [Oleomonas cavernae]RJF94824.1 DUF2786 domain-containing protein [Oleomonas cavernae]